MYSDIDPNNASAGSKEALIKADEKLNITDTAAQETETLDSVDAIVKDLEGFVGKSYASGTFRDSLLKFQEAINLLPQVIDTLSQGILQLKQRVDEYKPDYVITTGSSSLVSKLILRSINFPPNQVVDLGSEFNSLLYKNSDADLFVGQTNSTMSGLTETSQINPAKISACTDYINQNHPELIGKKVLFLDDFGQSGFKGQLYNLFFKQAKIFGEGSFLYFATDSDSVLHGVVVDDNAALFTEALSKLVSYVRRGDKYNEYRGILNPIYKRVKREDISSLPKEYLDEEGNFYDSMGIDDREMKQNETFLRNLTVRLFSILNVTINAKTTSI